MRIFPCVVACVLIYSSVCIHCWSAETYSLDRVVPRGLWKPGPKSAISKPNIRTRNSVWGGKGLRAIWGYSVFVWLCTCISLSGFLYLSSSLSTDWSDCCSAHHYRRGDICQSNMGAGVGCHPHLPAGQQNETQESPKATFDGLTSLLMPSAVTHRVEADGYFYNLDFHLGSWPVNKIIEL